MATAREATIAHNQRVFMYDFLKVPVHKLPWQLDPYSRSYILQSFTRSSVILRIVRDCVFDIDPLRKHG